MRSIVSAVCVSLSCSAMFSPAVHAALEFRVVSLESNIMTLRAANGYEISVIAGSGATLTESTGQVKLSAPANFALRANGFSLTRVYFRNIDDMDDAGPRDSFIASVPGKWTDQTDLSIAENSDGLEIFTLDPGVPVSWSDDERGRLRGLGVGDILINTSGGENPKREAANFTPFPAVEEFSIFMDDIDGPRGATMSFFLAPDPDFGIQAFSADISDAVAPNLVGPDGLEGTVTNAALFETVASGHDPDIAALQVDANEPISEWRLSGDDASSFAIEGGQIRFLQSPDHEAPTDSDKDNRYEVLVEAVDLAGNTTVVPVTIDVTPDGTSSTYAGAPAIEAEATYQVEEYTEEAIDQLVADQPVTWGIKDTLDGSQFEIDSAGVLRFSTPPAHSSPTDADSDNQYSVTVTATDSDGVTTETVVSVDVTPKAPTLTGPQGPDSLVVGDSFYQAFYEGNYVVENGTRVEDDSNTFNPKNQFDPVLGRNYAGTITSDIPIDTWTRVEGSEESPDYLAFTITDGGLVFFDHDAAASNDPPDFENPNDADGDNIYVARFRGEAENGEIVFADFEVRIKDLVEGLLPGSESDSPQYVDSDGDGIPDSIDPNPAEYDPQGYFYCRANGQIIPGGSIAVTGPSGSNSTVGIANGIRIVKDGSDGEFQWFALEEGTFSVAYTAPEIDAVALAMQDYGSLDVTTLLPDNPAFIGSMEDGDSGTLVDFSDSANRFYSTFTIEAGDPHVLGNNVPLENCADLVFASEATPVAVPVGAGVVWLGLGLLLSGVGSYRVRGYWKGGGFQRRQQLEAGHE